MPFNSYKTIGAVVKQFQIIYQRANFIVEEKVEIGDYFRQEFDFFLREFVVDNSEYAICENIISPILRELWKSYKDDFLVWSHQPLSYDETLSGIPDYIVAKRSPLGQVVFDKPFVIVIEAKKDNFDEGWGQCLAALIAVQKINNDPEQTTFGIVTNGSSWELAMLHANILTRSTKNYTISDLDRLFAALNYIFNRCRLQLRNRQLVEKGI